MNYEGNKVLCLFSFGSLSFVCPCYTIELNIPTHQNPRDRLSPVLLVPRFKAFNYGWCVVLRGLRTHVIPVSLSPPFYLQLRFMGKLKNPVQSKITVTNLKRTGECECYSEEYGLRLQTT